MTAQLVSIALNPDLAGQLDAAAATTGLSPPDLILRCIRDHLAGVVAYGRVTDELTLIKDSLLELSGLIGEALAEPDERAVGEICRYKVPKGSRPA